MVYNENDKTIDIQNEEILQNDKVNKAFKFIFLTSLVLLTFKPDAQFMFSLQVPGN